MRFPSFIPMEETKRIKKQWIGLLIEMAVWSYFIVFLVKIFFFDIIMRYLEYLAYQTPPLQFASIIIEKLQ